MSSFDLSEFRRATVERFVERELLVKEANRRRLTLLPVELDAYQNRFAADFAEKLPMTFKAIIEALGPRSVAFRANLKRDALACKMRETIRDAAIACVRATPADAMREQAVVRRINLETAATNAAICAAATNAWRSIRAGNDIDVVGRKLLEMRTDVTYSADCVRTNSPFAKLAVGKVSPPTEMGNDLVIAKALGTGLDGKPHFAMISFLLYDQFVVPTVEGAMKELFENGVNAGVDAQMEKLRKAAKITMCPYFDELNR